MELVVHGLHGEPVENKPIEIVERKGLGHPDTICDGIAEEIARNVTRYYYEEFGFPYHFNLDKAVLVGGQAQPKFGGGIVIEPIEFFLAGRATLEVNGRKVPIGSIILQSVNEYIKKHFRYLDCEEHITVNYRVRPGSIDLRDIYREGSRLGVPLANDTSIGVGFAPLSDTEKVCLEIEKLLNDRVFKERLPAVGEDIKVMCIRNRNVIRATVAMAVIDREVDCREDYREVLEKVKEEILKEIPKKIASNKILEVTINAADDPDKNRFYLTVTGTSAEAGDDGQIGRGNRANGLITPMRPMSIEAPAGKNAVSHVGKIYQIVSQRISERIIKEVSDIREVYVYIVSMIGKPITQPQSIYIEIISDRDIKNIRGDIVGIVENELGGLVNIWQEFIEGKIRTY